MQQGFYFCTRVLVGFERDIIVTAGAYGYYRERRESQADTEAATEESKWQ